MLKMENVRKEYRQFTLECSMEVQKGHVTGLVGENGAGKSTSFKAALGLIRTEGGEITLLGKKGEDLTEADRAQIGAVFSDSGMSGYLTVKDTAAILGGFYGEGAKKKFLEKCGDCGLPFDKKIKDFSTGMRAKLKLFIALCHDTRLLILDEPTAGLDVVARGEVLDMLREYMEEEEDRAILISSHISKDLESICDDLYMIHEGRIVLHEDTDELLSSYAVLKLREEQYREIDRQYLLRIRKEPFGYRALTDQKQFYMENYPKAVIENSSIDDVLTMMIQGERV